MNGLISVILPFRNAGETVDAALCGLLARDTCDLEVLAIDDGSLDSGPERVRSWAQRDARVRLFQASQSGLVGALQTGFQRAAGGLIARMDADDLCHPLRLEKQRDHLNAHPEVALVGSQVEVTAADGEPGEGLVRYVAWQNGLITPEDHRRELFVESPLCHPSVMLRREAFEQVGGYRDTGGPEDYDLWLRLDAARFRMSKLPEVLLTWRHRSGRATSTLR